MSRKRKKAQHLHALLHGDAATNIQAIRSLKAKADEKRTTAERTADWASDFFGSVGFLTANIIWFAVWIVVNVGLIPGVEPFDPFPFGLLTMIVSLEAIILAIMVLISQNRVERIAELREEVDLQIDMITEQELTKLLEMVCMLLDKHGIDYSHDVALQKMLAPTNVEKLETVLEEQILPNRNGSTQTS